MSGDGLDVVTVPGHALVSFLEDHDPARTVHVDPPPASWAQVKPGLVRALRHRGGPGRPRPVLENVPACIMGSEHETLPLAKGTGHELPGCRGCRMRPHCSPPAVWDAGMQPYGPADPVELWSLYADHFKRKVWDPADSRIDAVMRAILATSAGLHARPVTVEPSIVIDGDVRPAFRAVVFQGRTPRDARLAHEDTRAMLATARRIQEIAFERVTFDLGELAGFSPFPLPLGFECTVSGLLLKAYVRVGHLAPARRGEALDVVRRWTAVGPEVDPDRIEMLGLGLSEAGLASAKVYLRADPTVARPELGLEARPPQDGLTRLSQGEALAVVDLLGARAPKWDFSVRKQLLVGDLLVAAVQEHLGPGRGALAEFLQDAAFRMDCVAVGARESATALYLELG